MPAVSHATNETQGRSAPAGGAEGDRYRPPLSARWRRMLVVRAVEPDGNCSPAARRRRCHWTARPLPAPFRASAFALILPRRKDHRAAEWGRRRDRLGRNSWG